MNKDELIALAMKLYDGGKGISYAKIADKFNADGISTASGKGKWEKKMVQRLVSADTLKKAEVKVGLKPDREALLESEVERLKEDNASLKRHLADSAGHVNGNLEVIYDQDKKIDSLTVSLDFFKRENERLESDNCGVRSDRDEVFKVLNTVKQDNELLQSVIIGLRSEIDRLRYENIKALEDERESLKTQRDCFKTESERLNRQLVESELKYKGLYESEITRLGSDLAVANQMIQELKDKQAFIKIEQKNQKNFEGWTLNNRSDGKGINLVKRVNGKHVAIYIGKTFDPDIARERIGRKIGKMGQITADNDGNDNPCLPLF